MTREETRAEEVTACLLCRGSADVEIHVSVEPTTAAGVALLEEQSLPPEPTIAYCVPCLRRHVQSFWERIEQLQIESVTAVRPSLARSSS